MKNELPSALLRVVKPSKASRRFSLQTDTTESDEESGHVSPFVDLILQLVLSTAKETEVERKNLCQTSNRLTNSHNIEHIHEQKKYNTE